MTTKTLPVHAGRRRILDALTAAITLMLGLASALGAGGVHAVDFTFQTTGGPSFGHSLRRPLSRLMPSRFGPRHCGQSPET
mgnify:CR=1 FL=1